MAHKRVREDTDDDRIERRRNTDELATVRRLIPSPGPKSVGFLVWWVLGLYADAHLEDLAAGDTLVLRKQTPISRTWQPAYRAH